MIEPARRVLQGIPAVPLAATIRLAGKWRPSRLISCNTQPVVRKFNTEGPMVPERHYWIPPFSRVDLDEMLELIADLKYFVLHAPRQTGKTTTLKALADRLNSSGAYICLYINVEDGQVAREDVDVAIRGVLSEIAFRAEISLGDRSLRGLGDEVLRRVPPTLAFKQFLATWSKVAAKPVVLLIDEIDALIGDALLTVLRQLRSGYDLRPAHFPQSVILCGLRDVRDYQIHSSDEGKSVGGASVFNIKAKSLRLGDFSKGEVRALLAQHTTETSQEFAAEAFGRVWELTRGQPWLVNALAYQACFDDDEGRDRSQPIGLDAIDRAKEALILNRVTHLHQLAERLREPRVRRVIEPVLAGAEFTGGVPKDDLDYAVDLGLVRINGSVQIANPIYREVIPRELIYSEERFIARWPEGLADRRKSLDMRALLGAFQEFYRRHSEHWAEVVEYKEAGPHLLLQAFLHRVVNSGGRVEREYALGRGRTDLLVLWPGREGVDPTRGERHVIECKVLRPGRGLESTVRTAVEQTTRYMDRCGARSGHVVIFDTRPGKAWEDRIFRRDAEQGVRPSITVWGI